MPDASRYAGAGGSGPGAARGRRIINILTLNISLPRFIRLSINTATIETQPAVAAGGPDGQAGGVAPAVAAGCVLIDFIPAAAGAGDPNADMNSNNHNNVFSVRNRLFRVIFMKIAFYLCRHCSCKGQYSLFASQFALLFQWF